MLPQKQPCPKTFPLQKLASYYIFTAMAGGEREQDKQALSRGFPEGAEHLSPYMGDSKSRDMIVHDITVLNKQKGEGHRLQISKQSRICKAGLVADRIL